MLAGIGDRLLLLKLFFDALAFEIVPRNRHAVARHRSGSGYCFGRYSKIKRQPRRGAKVAKKNREGFSFELPSSRLPSRPSRLRGCIYFSHGFIITTICPTKLKINAIVPRSRSRRPTNRIFAAIRGGARIRWAVSIHNLLRAELPAAGLPATGKPHARSFRRARRKCLPLRSWGHRPAATPCQGRLKKFS